MKSGAEEEEEDGTRKKKWLPRMASGRFSCVAAAEVEEEEEEKPSPSSGTRQRLSSFGGRRRRVGVEFLCRIFFWFGGKQLVAAAADVLFDSFGDLLSARNVSVIHLSSEIVGSL